MISPDALPPAASTPPPEPTLESTAATVPLGPPSSSPPAAASPSPRRPRGLRLDRAVLGLAWLHGALHAAVYRKQAPVTTWTASRPITTLDEFEPALDELLHATQFSGTEVFLVLEHEQFQHQPEQAPAFSETATRAYLKAHVARLEHEREPLLWVSQRTSSARNDASVLLHLLASSFYDQLNRLMLGRRLELTRILPLVVPLQLVLDGLPEAREAPVLLLAPAGRTTLALAGRAGAPLFFTRTILTPWDGDPARLGVELNRSLLYAKQQFGTSIARIRVLGTTDEGLLASLRARCSSAPDLTALASGPFDWLQAIARLTPRHPVNLVAGYLSDKQRQRLLRRLLLAACGLALMLTALDTIRRLSDWHHEQHRFAALRAGETTLQAERDRLTVRNETAAQHEAFLAQAEAARLPPVPARFASFLAGALPPEARLLTLTIKQHDESPGWSLRLEGVITGDEDSARELLAGFERQLTRSVFRARFSDAGRTLVILPPMNPGQPGALRFALEGGLLEN